MDHCRRTGLRKVEGTEGVSRVWMLPDIGPTIRVGITQVLGETRQSKILELLDGCCTALAHM